MARRQGSDINDGLIFLIHIKSGTWQQGNLNFRLFADAIVV